MSGPFPDPIVAIAADGPDLDPARHGAKACGLQRLLRFGLDVPAAVVVPIETAAVIAAGVESGADLSGFAELVAAVDGLGGDVDRLTVRSGAAISLPGAFETSLDVLPEVVHEAIASVVASTRGLRVEAIVSALGIERVPPTAAIVQCQVDATVDTDSCAGVATSHDPVTGEPGLHGSLAWQTQGNAVMAGTVPVDPIASLRRCPDVFSALETDVARLHAEEDSPVEVEFVVESGRLWYVQLRPFRVALIAAPPPLTGSLLGQGRAASPGVGTGELHVDLDDALDAIEAGRPVIVALETASPAAVPAMVKAAGVVTVLGGPDSHAAVVARGAGVPAVVAVQGLRIGPSGITINDVSVDVGTPVAVDGSRGQVRTGPT